MIWLWIYLGGLLFTWIIAYGLIYKDFTSDSYTGPVEAILISGLLSMIISWIWPIIIVIFGIHRIATRTINNKEV